MHLGYTFASGRGDTDLLLAKFANEAAAEGLRIAGTVQINEMCADDGLCDMDVRVLPNGPIIRISQSLGRGAKGCRLDPAALEEAVGLVSQSLTDGLDCLIINKFGKHEADGRGFRPVISEALALGIPVIVGIGRLNRDAFIAFSDGLAEEIAPDSSAIKRWLDACLDDRNHVVGAKTS
ncbi:MAG: DUF2478 domain-containing protein [Boseongicola sp.]|nr:DUF2478 domain-containing protein [Boseongicola sp.]MDD9979431.1 DUF2478 domain-containing protein [Boseongicola sp.]